MNNLFDFVYRKIMHFKTTHDVEENLKKIYEGDTKLKLVKLQVLREKFEGLKMSKEEKIASYL
jgi:hypothetical protein